jgi:hypothetical protein
MDKESKDNEPKLQVLNTPSGKDILTNISQH